MKDREKVKALLNGIDVVNVEQWTQISSAHIAEIKDLEYFESLGIRAGSWEMVQ